MNSPHKSAILVTSCCSTNRCADLNDNEPYTYDFCPKMTCKTCKYWGQEGVFYPPKGLRPLDTPWTPVHYFEHRHCSQVWCGEQSPNPAKASFLVDGDDYVFGTGPEFGCIHWEAK